MDNIPPLKDALFSTPMLRVLAFLCDHADRDFIDTEVAAQVKGIRKSAVNIGLRRLAALGLTVRTRRGRMVFNRLIESPIVTHVKILSNLAAIQPLVSALASLCAKIVLFGSQYDGTSTSESDVDLFAVTHEEDKVRRTLHKMKPARDIQFLARTPEQMLTFAEDEPVLYDEIKKGIILWQKS